ncbi:MAG: hypothetical protein HY393_01955 [Candidatus Diapherotrites archaeon]|nr:hypothetical protein [Candidatus Diapherotrites archaeon]
MDSERGWSFEGFMLVLGGILLVGVVGASVYLLATRVPEGFSEAFWGVRVPFSVQPNEDFNVSFWMGNHETRTRTYDYSVYVGQLLAHAGVQPLDPGLQSEISVLLHAPLEVRESPVLVRVVIRKRVLEGEDANTLVQMELYDWVRVQG